LPATISTIGLYISDLAAGGAKVATISRKLAAISFRHKEEKLPSPCSMKADRQLAQVYTGIRKTTGTKQEGKAAVTLKLIRRMVDTVEGTLTASRDRALILIGFAGGLRRSELAGIRCTITLPRSKTDQEGQGREVEIARGSQPENTPLSACTCPVRALDQWLRQAGIESGPVFRKVNRGENVQKTALNPASVAWILKRALGRAGVRDLDRYGAHSLRAGFATAAFDNGVPEFKIRQQTGHKTSRMLEKYLRSEQKARQEAASSLGL
jgi:integrase